MFVYVIVCSETLKIYVGQHKHNDLGKYLSRKFWDANHHTPGTRSYLYNAMRKHPRDSWSIHHLVSGVESKPELDELERHYIRALKVQHPDVGYNICAGGGGTVGCKHSLESIRRAVEGCQKSPTWRQRQSESHKKYSPQKKGAIFAEGHKKNLSLSHKGIPWSAARKAAQKRREQSGAQLETNRLRSEACMGRTPWNKGISGYKIVDGKVIF